MIINNALFLRRCTVKTSTKWIIGIAAAFLLLVVVVGVASMMFRYPTGSSWAYGVHTGRLWSPDTLPPEHPTFVPPIGKSLFHLSPRPGFYSIFPFGILAMLLLCLCTLPLILLVVVLAVVFSQKRSPETTAAPAAVAPPAASSQTEELADESDSSATSTCAHCGQPVEPEWVVCPYCGSPLSDEA